MLSRVDEKGRGKERKGKERRGNNKRHVERRGERMTEEVKR